MERGPRKFFVHKKQRAAAAKYRGAPHVNNAHTNNFGRINQGGTGDVANDAPSHSKVTTGGPCSSIQPYAQRASTDMWSNICEMNPDSAAAGNALQPSHNAVSAICDSLSVMQINGHRVVTSQGVSQTSERTDVELYVRRIPSRCSEAELLHLFQRFGKVKRIRLPLDPSQDNRGFGYVVYTSMEDALCAMDVVKYYFINQHHSLELLVSQNKRRLYVSNIPQQISYAEVKKGLKTLFPKLKNLFFDAHESQEVETLNICPSVLIPKNTKNHGYVFIHFADHNEAVIAKKVITPGVVRLWNRDLKIAWAVADQPETDTNANNNNCALYIPNFDASMSVEQIKAFLTVHVQDSSIKRICRYQGSTFVEFNDHYAALGALHTLDGTPLDLNNTLTVKWTKSKRRSPEINASVDYDANLRLRCIANFWEIPIILYGAYFPAQQQQYAVIILRSFANVVRAIFLIMSTNCPDLHDRICEIGCILIDHLGTFPDYNYIIQVEKNVMRLVGLLTHNVEGLHLISAFQAPPQIEFDYTELVDLSWATAMLAAYDMGDLLKLYETTLQVNEMPSYLDNRHINGMRRIAAIPPKFRNNPPLPHGLNDTQIVLALNFIISDNNMELPNRPFSPYPINAFFNGYVNLRYFEMTLRTLPQEGKYVSFVCSGDPTILHPGVCHLNIFACLYAHAIRYPERVIREQNYQLVPAHDVFNYASTSGFPYSNNALQHVPEIQQPDYSPWSEPTSFAQGQPPQMSGFSPSVHDTPYGNQYFVPYYPMAALTSAYGHDYQQQ